MTAMDSWGRAHGSGATAFATDTLDSMHTIDVTQDSARGAMLAVVRLAGLLAKSSRQGSAPVLIRRGRELTPYRRVLVAVDFSPGAYTAARYASALAPDAQLALLCVGGTFPRADTACGESRTHSKPASATIHAQLMEQLARFAQDLGPCSHLMSRIARFGSPAVALAAYADRMRADLLVVPSTYPRSKGIASRAALLLQLCRSTRCDVLVMPPAEVTEATADAALLRDSPLRARGARSHI